MRTMKVIDLYNKIANGKEVPKKIKYREMIYHICYEYGDYESDIEEYRDADIKEHYYLFEDIDMLKCLNDEVEIIEDTPKEDKKIEQIRKSYDIIKYSQKDKKNIYDMEKLIDMVQDIYNKQSEIIDKINGGD